MIKVIIISNKLIASGNINNFRYADDITLMAESEEELKSFLMRVKEESEKTGLKLSIKKTKIMTYGPITSWQTEKGKVEARTNFIFLGSKITEDDNCSHEIKRCSLLGRKAMQLCPTLCDPMNLSTQGLPVRHQLLEFTQTHVH